MNNITFPLRKLFILHVFIIVLSNYAVQIPFTVFGLHTTWGAFTYPFIFITTDLTVRLYGATMARKVVLFAMIPALILSYIVGTIFESGNYQGIESLGIFSIFVFRIALASFGAYVLGQIADILVFSRLRKLSQWWIAPSASSVAGNLLDTFAFFFIAFYQTTDAFMAAHWVELAWFDYFVKIMACLMIFIPIYGLMLSFIAKYILKKPLSELSAI